MLHSQLKELRDESAICKVETRVDGQRMAEAELLFVFNPDKLDTEEAQKRLEELERKNLSILWHGYKAWNERVRAQHS